jgi:predicted amidophosphoribosyltransferase
MGYDEFGRERFDTKRTEIGEALFRLKYRAARSAISDILDTVVSFLTNTWKISGKLDCVVYVPPSNVRRSIQPVIEIAKGISERLRIPLNEHSLVKTKETPELKNVYEHDERLKVLEGAFEVRDLALKEKRVLLFDDLYRSGATLEAITQVLYKNGLAKAVYVLVLTKTRSRT